jgi:hypothetical protein
MDRRPGRIVQCSGTADVIDAVNLAREYRPLTGGTRRVVGSHCWSTAMAVGPRLAAAEPGVRQVEVARLADQALPLLKLSAQLLRGLAALTGPGLGL